jgi:TatA/E family protein of Tat protein translocase
MDFLGIGGGEILVIMLIAVLLWGPGRIVEIARGAGKIIHNLKSTTSEFTNQISKELEEEKKNSVDKPEGIEKVEIYKNGST